MKNLLIALLLPAVAYAQDPGSADGPRPSFPRVPVPGDSEGAAPGSAPQKGNRPDGWLEKLPPELRQRFEAARAKAMQDPKVQELRRKADAAAGEFREAMREAIKAADPELAEHFRKFAEKRMERKDGDEDRRPPGFGNLSESDRQRLMSAREKAKSDPGVAAAMEMRKSATTPEQRAAAAEAYHKAMREALLRADPTLGPLLDQLRESGERPQRKRPGGNKAQDEMPLPPV